MDDFKVVLPVTTKEWQRDMNLAYNQALEDVLNVVEWDDHTLDIKERIEKLKK